MPEMLSVSSSQPGWCDTFSRGWPEPLWMLHKKAELDTGWMLNQCSADHWLQGWGS